MSKITVFTNMTLDGVMQAPGRPDEDTRGSFQYGGWAAPYGAMQDAGDALSFTGALLFGRRTYEDFYSFWPNQKNNPFTEIPKITKSLSCSFFKFDTLFAASPIKRGELLQGRGSLSVVEATYV